MGDPGVRFHKLAIFGRAVVITVVLLSWEKGEFGFCLTNWYYLVEAQLYAM